MDASTLGVEYSAYLPARNGTRRDGLSTQAHRISMKGIYRLHPLPTLMVTMTLGLAALSGLGCSTNQLHAQADVTEIALRPGELERHGLAFITPSTVTGQEEDKQNLAFVFAKVLKERRPEIPLVSLPETLSAINRAGLAEEYRAMYADYRDTGIFKKESLRKVGQITGTRYLAQLKLSNFTQDSKGRFNFLGLRLLQTKQANIRLFFQIWDSQDGSIVWEGTEELNYTWDTPKETPVTFQLVVGEVARNLVGRLP